MDIPRFGVVDEEKGWEVSAEGTKFSFLNLLISCCSPNFTSWAWMPLCLAIIFWIWIHSLYPYLTNSREKYNFSVFILCLLSDQMNLQWFILGFSTPDIDNGIRLRSSTKNVSKFLSVNFIRQLGNPFPVGNNFVEALKMFTLNI